MASPSSQRLVQSYLGIVTLNRTPIDSYAQATTPGLGLGKPS